MMTLCGGSIGCVVVLQVRSHIEHNLCLSQPTDVKTLYIQIALQCVPQYITLTPLITHNESLSDVFRLNEYMQVYAEGVSGAGCFIKYSSLEI